MRKLIAIFKKSEVIKIINKHFLYFHLASKTKLANYIIGYMYNIFVQAMATHSSTLAWKIPWAEEPGRLQSMGSQRVGHD